MPKIIKPFSRQGHFTIFDNFILDEIMPQLGPNAWKVLCFIIRKTIGWQKDNDSLSFSQIKTGTGIKNNTTVSKALNDLEDFELGALIKRRRFDQAWTSNNYSLNRELAINVSSTEIVPDSGTEIVPESGTEIVHTKAKRKKGNKSDPLTDIFLGQGTTPTQPAPNPVPDDAWLKYGDQAVEIYARLCGNLGQTAQERATRKNIIAGFASEQNPFLPDLWETSINESLAAGVGPRNIARFIEVYKVGGQYQTWLKKKYPVKAAKSTNGNTGLSREIW